MRKMAYNRGRIRQLETWANFINNVQFYVLNV